MTHRSRVLGIGMSVPSRVVTNFELATKMETSNERIIERTGIEEPRWVSEGETGSTPARAAAGRDVTVLFGDGAGAVVVGRATDDAHVILSNHIHADGSEAEILWTEYPASPRPQRISAD